MSAVEVGGALPLRATPRRIPSTLRSDANGAPECRASRTAIFRYRAPQTHQALQTRQAFVSAATSAHAPVRFPKALSLWWGGLEGQGPSNSVRGHGPVIRRSLGSAAARSGEDEPPRTPSFFGYLAPAAAVGAGSPARFLRPEEPCRGAARLSRDMPTASEGRGGERPARMALQPLPSDIRLRGGRAPPPAIPACHCRPFPRPVPVTLSFRDRLGGVLAVLLGQLVIHRPSAASSCRSDTGWMLSGRIGPIRCSIGWAGRRSARMGGAGRPAPILAGDGARLLDLLRRWHPILAFAFKALRRCRVAQYWGLWIYACGALQAWLPGC